MFNSVWNIPPRRRRGCIEACWHWAAHHHWLSSAICVLLLTFCLGVLAYLIYEKVGQRHHHHPWCPQPALTVAADGKGNFTTISAAVAAAPDNSPIRFCISIGEGEYRENVQVALNKTNLVLVGAGVGKTVLNSDRSASGENFPADQLATLLVKGKGFMARDITIINSAGANKDLTVALENQSPESIFFRCNFISYRGTLFAFKEFQFYHSCEIRGTQNFIFGDAMAVFQKCKITAIKLPLEDTDIVSGQSRLSPSSNTGFVFHLCDFHTDVNAMNGTEVSMRTTYLGSPLQLYSRTIVMQSFLDASIAGWLVNDSSPIIVYFAEYGNKGPGAVNARIQWSPLVRLLNESSIASQFTVRVFLGGNEWIPSYVPHTLDLV